MKKTELYQLNQWEMSDRIRMEDFNADNVRLEAILEGKTGRFQKIGQWVIGDGAHGAGLSFHTDDWSKWECVLGIYDLHETEFLPDDYFEISLQYPNFTYSNTMGGLSGGSLMVAMFPFHDKTANIRGIALGTGGRTLCMGRTFEELKGVSLWLRNKNSTHILKESTTTLQNPVWAIYGLK